MENERQTRQEKPMAKTKISSMKRRNKGKVWDLSAAFGELNGVLLKEMMPETKKPIEKEGNKKKTTEKFTKTCEELKVREKKK